MERRKNVQPDIAMRIGHDAHDRAHFLRRQHVHDFGNERSRAGRHRFEPAEIHQRDEAGHHIRHLFANPRDGLLRFVRGDLSGDAEDEKLPGGVGFDDKHQASVAMSTTKRYFTSLFSIRSYASLIWFIEIFSMSQTTPRSAHNSSI